MKLIFLSFTFIFISFSFAQNTTDSTFKSYGEISGLFFGDYAYKLNADSLNRGNLEYSGLPKNNSLFNIRRLYFGYEYFLSPKLSTELVLTYEGQTPVNTTRKYFY